MVWPPGVSPMASLQSIDAGMFIPKNSLDRWAVNPPVGVRHIAFAGDSTMQGDNSQVVLQVNTYQDSYLDRFRRAMGVAAGPLVGWGSYPLWRSRNILGQFQSVQEWGAAGITQNPQDNSILFPFSTVFGGNGAANTATFTPPTNTVQRTVKDAQTTNGTTTIGAGSNGVNINTFAGAGVLTAGAAIPVGTGPGQFPATGTVCLSQTLPLGLGNIAIVTYTGIAGSTFTGCTFIAGTAFVMATGGIITNTNIVASASAAFVGNDQGSIIWGTNIVRNNSIVLVASATVAVTFLPNTGAAAVGVLGIQGRNQMIGGIAQIDVIYVDFQFANQWSYSLSGAAFVNGPASTHPATPILKKFSIVTANPTTFALRCADAAATAVLAQFCEIVVYSSVAPTSGFVVHNLAKDGATLNGGTGNGFLTSPTALGAGGDSLRFLDGLGDSASTGSLYPALTVVMFVNDMANIGNPATYVADLETLRQRVTPFGDLLVMNPWEIGVSGQATQPMQAAYRAAVKAWAQTNNVALLDIYDAWAALGAVGSAGAITAGLVTGDGTHPTSVGHIDIAARLCRMIGLSFVP